MANILLSENEKLFIVHGVQANFRIDGRNRRDYRPMELETGLVTTANGSARVRLANSDIMCSVKAEIDVPSSDRLNEGKIEFFVDCSANATPEFEGRGGEELSMEIASLLDSSYSSSHSFDLKTLCIMFRQQCWKLHVDVLILECGGNLYDAVSMSVKAALFNTKLPRVSTALMDGGTADLILSDNPYDVDRLDIEAAPVLVTLCKIGDHCVVDASVEEEACSLSSLVVGVSCLNNKGRITTIKTASNGTFEQSTLLDAIDLSVKAALVLNKELMKALQTEEKLSDENEAKFGFLK